MNLRPLSRSDLMASARTAVRNETHSTTVVLYHLREIERRMLHAEMGYESLREFAIKELGYSAGAADRRIAAMRLMREIPDLEERIKEGELKLSTLCQAQSYFRNEKIKDVEEKKAVLEEIAHLSDRQCLRVLAEKRGETEPTETRRPLAGGKTLISHVLEEETENLLQEIQVELGRTLKMKELVREMAEITLKTLRKRKDASTAKPRKAAKNVNKVENVDPNANAENTLKKVPRARVVIKETPAPWSACVIEPNDIPIPPLLRRAVWRRDQGRCQYQDPVTGKQCECRKYLEVEHIIARALGGENSLGNLQLLCRTHNRFRAVQTFGRAHMSKFHPGLH